MSNAGQLNFPSPILPPVPTHLLTAEIAALSDSHLLLRSGATAVYCARMDEIPNLMTEIGRQREITFRSIGEGSGKECDTDVYDAWYEHLFAWDEENEQLVGAYRFGRIDQLLYVWGKAGLYTSSLFHFDPALFEAMGPTLELGRSFVREEYQCSTGLFLLWRGIASWLANNPSYRRLMGPVSIDRCYRDHSIRLMVAHLQARFNAGSLQRHVEATNPFHAGCILSDTPEDPGEALADLERWVKASEPDGRGVPVLIRHYLRLGGRVLAFNVDRDFADVVDALMVVDLDEMDPRRMARFMGREASAGYRAFKQAS